MKVWVNWRLLLGLLVFAFGWWVGPRAMAWCLLGVNAGLLVFITRLHRVAEKRTEASRVLLEECEDLHRSAENNADLWKQRAEALRHLMPDDLHEGMGIEETKH